MTSSFATNFTVPRAASTTRTPDPTAPVAARLDPGLAVWIKQRHGDWAQIVCSNGWEASVDGRLLVVPSASPGAPTSSSGLAVAGMGLLSLAGAAAV